MDRALKITIAAVLAWLTVCVFVAIRISNGPTTSIFRSFDSYPVILESRLYQFVPVGRSPDDLAALQKAMQPAAALNGRWNRNPFDTGDVEELRISGRVFGVGNNTPATVIDKGKGLLLVRVDKGVNAGRAGWVSEGDSRAPGTDNFALQELQEQIMDNSRIMREAEEWRRRNPQPFTPPATR